MPQIRVFLVLQSAHLMTWFRDIQSMIWNLQRGTPFFDTSFMSSYWGIYWPYKVYVHFYIESINLLWIKHIWNIRKVHQTWFISTCFLFFFHASQIFKTWKSEGWLCPRPKTWVYWSRMVCREPSSIKSLDVELSCPRSLWFVYRYQKNVPFLHPC